MVYLQFLILATLVVLCAIQLSKQAEIIEANSKINVLIIGAILALTTSLPELATGLTSVYIGQPVVTISNVLGSNIFNLTILAVMNIFFLKETINSHINKHTNRMNIVVMIMYLIFTFGIVFYDANFLLLGHINIISIFIIITYIVGIKSLRTQEDSSHEEEMNYDQDIIKKATYKFILFGIVVLFASIFLAFTADEIMAISNLSASFVGAVFIGITTSLPELATTITLVKNRHFNLAGAGIFGSNMFNFLILAIIDFTSSSPLYTQEAGVFKLILIGITFVLITFISIKIKNENKWVNLIGPFLMMLTFFLYILIT